MSDIFTLRDPCKCGGSHGYITPRNGQDLAYCSDCGTWQYNVPRTESGRKPRTLATREGLTVAQRAQVLDTYGHACIYCGKRPPEVRLEMEHMIPRELAKKHGVLDDLIDSIHNLAPACPECNSGHRYVAFTSRSVALMVRALSMAAQAAEHRTSGPT